VTGREEVLYTWSTYCVQ